MAQTFTTDLVRRAIKSCRNSKAFGPDKLSIFHLKNLGPRAIEYITALFNLSVTTCQIPAIWKSSLIIPIPKPGKDTSVGTSYRPTSLLCPAAKVLESLILPTINKCLQPAPDQHGFRPDHSTTSALLQMTTYIAMGFNQRKPPDRTIYRLRLTQSAVEDQQITVKRVCYADDITVWATGVKIPDLEDSVNSYLEEIIAYLKDNLLLISAPKSTVTLFSPDPHQAKTHPRILIEDSQLPLAQCPKILGV